MPFSLALTEIFKNLNKLNTVIDSEIYLLKAENIRLASLQASPDGTPADNGEEVRPLDENIRAEMQAELDENLARIAELES